jgi:ubiquinone/menaquinone biosynthesis C-methylase UbiE
VTPIISKFIQLISERIGLKFDIHKLKKINDFCFVIIEKIIIKLQKLHPLYLDFYNEMIENEIRLANITKDDKILHIGCGSFPATSIILAKKTNANITNIDNKYKSVKQAQLIVSKYNLSNQIKIIHADANHFPMNEFDLVLLSQGIKPHKEILTYVSQSIKPETRVIFRSSSEINGEFSQNDIFLKDIFNFVKIVNNKKNGLLISILLNKK